MFLKRVLINLLLMLLWCQATVVSADSGSFSSLNMYAGESITTDYDRVLDLYLYKENLKYPHLKIVEKDEKYGIVDTSKKWEVVLDIDYRTIRCIEDTFIAQKDQTFYIGYLNEGFNTIGYLEVNDICYNLGGINYVYTRGSKLGIADREGTIITEAIYDEISPFMEGYASFMMNEKYGVLRVDGQVIIEADKYDKIKLTKKGHRLVAITYIDDKFVDEIELERYGEDIKLVSVKENEKLVPARNPVTGAWGYQTLSGQWAIEPRFTRTYEFSEGLAAVSSPETGGLGYIDRNGNYVIEPIFVNLVDIRHDPEDARFKNGKVLAYAEDSDQVQRVGMIDREGNWLIEPRYYALNVVGQYPEYIASFIMSNNDKTGYITKDGILVEPRYQWFKKIGAEYYMYTVDRSDIDYYLMSEHQQPKATVVSAADETITTDYDRVLDLYCYKENLKYPHLKIVEKDDKYGIVDTSKKWEVVLDIDYRNIRCIEDTFIAKKDQTFYIGYLNEEFDTIGYLEVNDICYNLGGINYVYIRGSKLGIADREGKIITEAIYDEISPFMEGYASFMMNEKYGVLRVDGQVIIEADKYDKIKLTKKGPRLVAITYIDDKFVDEIELERYGEDIKLVSVKENEKLVPARNPVTGAWGYQTLSGQWAIEPRFTRTYEFSEGLAAVSSPETGGLGYIDRNGNYVIEPIFVNLVDIRHDPEDARFKNGKVLAYAEDSDQVQRVGMINREGNWLIEPRYYALNVVSQYPEYIASFIMSNNDKTGYITKDGILVEPRYQWFKKIGAEYYMYTIDRSDIDYYLMSEHQQPKKAYIEPKEK